MSDTIVKMRRPGGITAIAIITLVISIYGLVSGGIFLLPMLATGHSSGLLSLIQFIDVPSFNNLSTEIVSLYDSMFSMLIPQLTGFFLVSILGIVVSRALLRSKPNGQLLAKIYAWSLFALVGILIIWMIFSMVSIFAYQGYDYDSGTHFGPLSNYMQFMMIFSESFSVVLGIIYAVVMLKITAGPRHREYFASLTR